MTRPGDRTGNRTDPGPDRGQILLVGAVSIALVFLGLVVVFNTVLFTDSAQPTEPLESAEEARSFDEQVRNDTRQILFRVAAESNETECAALGEFCTYAENNITNYSLNLSTSYSDTGPVYAAVKVHGVAGNTTGVLTGCPSSRLCANISIIYRTSDFTYNNTVTVESEVP